VAIYTKIRLLLFSLLDLLTNRASTHEPICADAVSSAHHFDNRLLQVVLVAAPPLPIFDRHILETGFIAAPPLPIFDRHILETGFIAAPPFSHLRPPYIGDRFHRRSASSHLRPPYIGDRFHRRSAIFPSSTAIYWRPVSSPLRHFPTIVICYEHFFAAFWEEKKGRARTSLSVPGLALRVYSSKLSRHELGPFAYCRHWSVLRLRLRDLRYGIHQVQPLPLLLGRPWSEGPFYRHLSGLLDVAHADCWRRRDCGANQGFPYQQGQEQRLKFSSKPRSSIYQPCTPPPF
jgi:hypothetical protein